MLELIKDFVKKLNCSSNAAGIVNILGEIFSPYNIGLASIYIYDETTSSLRDFAKSWIYIDEFLAKEKSKKIYEIFSRLTFDNFINEQNVLYYPVFNGNKVIGILEITGEISERLIEFMNLISIPLSLKIQNIILSEKMQKIVDFHDSMKNIAKIIETQYEINYIVPIIGEMIDKFVSGHLVYVFLCLDNSTECRLVWPGACNDNKIYEMIKCLNNNSEYILTPDKKIGIFPLISENKLLGCIVTKSTDNVLGEKEIEYLEQLTNQAATTINRANVYAEILQHATLDALTGLYNRHQLEERIKQEIAGAKRQNRHLCAIMTDIDFFKTVNDTYGHTAGDLVLKTVANVIKSELREYDTAGRYGGEEFVILLPATTGKEALMVAERLRKSVENKKIDISKINPDTDKKSVKVTLSLGVYEYQENDNENDIIKKADLALYKAKETGRNKVVDYIQR